jgi:hypothetical protein
MKMELAMTERDKKLLVFLAIFVVIVCFGYWGVRPIWNSITEIEEQIADDEDIQAMNDIKISELPLIQKDIEDLENDISTARGNYFSMMTSDEVDRYFTDMVLSHNLSSYDLEITMPENSCNLQPYQYSKKFLKEDEEETEVDLSHLSQIEQVEEEAEEEDAEDAEDEDQEDTDEEVADNGIYVAEISMRLGGQLSDLTKLINELSNTDRKLRVSQYSYSTTQSIQTGEDETYEVSENRVLNMTVEIYMCED